MNQSDKELLLKDLSARIGFGTMVNEPVQGDFELIGVVRDRIITTCEEEGKMNDFPVELVRPYLRPLSSMTSSEQEELTELSGHAAYRTYMYLGDGTYEIYYGTMSNVIDWMRTKQFDHNGLIPKGLAIEKK